MESEDKAKLCALMTKKFLHGVLKATKEQTKTNPLRWRSEGGPEFEDFVHAIETGGSHPLLEEWQTHRTKNRPGPGLLDQNVRRNVVLMVEALHRAGLGPDAARKRASKTLSRVLPEATPRAIKYWQAGYVFSLDDERLIAQAIERYGHDLDRLAGWLSGLICYADNPIMAWSLLRRQLPPAGQ
jgi:hypothetical protein